MVDHDKIPLMFRAQVPERCQLQNLIAKQNKQQAYNWVEQWIEGVGTLRKFGKKIKVKDYQITWRFVTNNGQDDNLIHPLIGANGFPFYPGSSMKGAFSRACTNEEALRYCGGKNSQETVSGILRFHGGYPQNLDWKEQKKLLVDLVHTQQEWQVKTDKKDKNALIQFSLYQPILFFGISSKMELQEQEWASIWEIWEIALGKGIGCGVSAGYGQFNIPTKNILLSVDLKGQGLASKLINKSKEFRPNMFKATLRGHTLRLLGGVTDHNTAERLTNELWGGIGGNEHSIVGKLGISFKSDQLNIKKSTDVVKNSLHSIPIYDVTGKLNIIYGPDNSEKSSEQLKNFVTNLLKFSLLLGGFGKSWRRVDHSLFCPQYFQNKKKPMIGCHWKLINQDQKLYIPVDTLGDINQFLDDLHQSLKNWIDYQQGKFDKNGCDWREAFHPDKVQVWGRIANHQYDSQAIHWFHGNYYQNQTIQKSVLTGKLGNIGRIWHRMYPRFMQIDNENKLTNQYIELLTIFPDQSQQTQDFL